MPRSGARAASMGALAAGVALGLAGASAAAAAVPIESTSLGTVRSVDHCDDDGPGSLREAVALAVSGETIDLSALTCGTITLASGALVVAQDDLAIIGPGTAALTIDGALADRVLRHVGIGTLRLSRLSLAYGSAGSNGGCIVSAGNLALDQVEVAACEARNLIDQTIVSGGALYAGGNIVLLDSRVRDSSAYSSSGSAFGGGVYARGALDLMRSTLSGNSAISMAPTGTLLPGGAAYAGAFGGGASSYGSLTLTASTVSANGALAPNNHGSDQANGGGVFLARGSVTIIDSTVDHNRADHNGGGVMTIRVFGSSTYVQNSTISGNSAGAAAGGLFSQPFVVMTNSTIAFNRADGTIGGGVMLGFDQTGWFDSSILANNAGASGAPDLSFDSRATLSGAHNLIGIGGETLAGTIQDDPRLGPLRDNGGPTRTHALLSGSPAIDAGSNPIAFAHDQRGDPHPRVLGAAADIGAFEFDTADTIFSDGFD